MQLPIPTDFPYNLLMEAVSKGALTRAALEEYFRGIYRGCRLLEFRALGSGVHGTGSLIVLETEEGGKTFVLKDIAPGGLGHDYPSDRAAVLLLALENYGKLPGHVKALEVLSLQKDNTLKAIGGGREYFLLMERAEGVNYFKDLEEFSKKERLDAADKEKIRVMAEYIKKIQGARPPTTGQWVGATGAGATGAGEVTAQSKTLYLRKLRDIIGHGECLMGVFDSYPEGVLNHREMADIEKKCIDWRARLKGRYRRLCQIHGDFHPGNIWWGQQSPPPPEASAESPVKSRLCLLDRSRGEWGEPADDVTALTINYVFFSIKHYSAVRGPYLEGFKLFFNEYIRLTGDEEVLEVLAPFYAFRGAVVANPLFYPELTLKQRRLIFRFVDRVLDAGRFEPERVDEYLM